MAKRHPSQQALAHDEPAVAPVRFRLRRRQRLRRREEFARAFREGVYAADAILVVSAIRNEQTTARLGVSIPRRVGNAVARNRWKRWIREAFRLSQHELPAGIDYVVRPKKGARGDARAVEQSLRKLAKIIERRLRQRESREPAP